MLGQTGLCKKCRRRSNAVSDQSLHCLQLIQFDGAPIRRLSEGKHGVVKLELTWQPPKQPTQPNRQKKTPGKKKEAESRHGTGFRSSAKTAPPAGEWSRQPSPARTPPTVKSPPVKSSTVDMVSPLGTPDVTPPPESRWTPKTKTPPCQILEDEEEPEVCEYQEDRSSLLAKYNVAKILHGNSLGSDVIIYQLKHIEKTERRPASQPAFYINL